MFRIVLLFTLLITFSIETLDAKNETNNNALIEAARNGDLEEVTMLIKKGALINYQTDYGYTALMWASDNGHAKIVKYLIEKCADVELSDTDISNTALLMASYQGHLEIVKMLIEADANINTSNDNDTTALMFALFTLSSEHLEVVKYLIAKGANVNAEDISGETILMMASGNKEIVKLLKEAGAKK